MTSKTDINIKQKILAASSKPMHARSRSSNEIMAADVRIIFWILRTNHVMIITRKLSIVIK